MEWVSYHLDGPIDKMNEVRKRRENENETILKQMKVGQAIYAAVKVKRNDIEHVQCEIFFVNTVKDYENVCFRHYFEDENPKFYECPKSILKLLSEPKTDNAMIWREKCYDKIDKKREKSKSSTSLQNLSINSVIELCDNERTILMKNYFLKFKKMKWVDWKRFVWYCEKDIEKIGYKVIHNGPEPFQF